MVIENLLDDFEQKGQLKRVNKKVSTEYEIAAELLKSEKAVIFENIENHSTRVAGNIYGSRERISMSLGIEKEQLIEKMQKALSKPQKPEEVEEGAVQEETEDKIELKSLPILKHFEKDGGPYTTASILVTKDSSGKRNLSFHRMMLIGKDQFSVRLVPRNLHRIFKEAEKRDESLEVAAVLGVHPSVALAAAMSPSYKVDEFEIAYSLWDNLKLTKCQTIDIEVPTHAEIVLEGKLLAGERAKEGPFADITGTYDIIRDQPIFKVDQITTKKNPIYPAILPSGSEHRLLMGMPREPLIFEEVAKVANVRNIALTPGGCGWLHAVISIEKKGKEDGKKAIEATFKAHPSLKHAVVVDKDINIFKSEEVEWAIATRFRADQDTVIKPNIKGSSLDPTADPETRLGSKMGLDATKDLDDPEKFERAEIPK